MNINKLKAKIREAGMSQAELAEKIGISQNSLSRKVNNLRQFTLSELVQITTILNIEDPREIFFTDNIPYTQRKE